MQIVSNRYLRILVSITLIIVILFNYSFKPKAEAFTISAVAIKVFGTILASMGILTFVTSQSGGLDGFYNEFIEYMEDIKGNFSIALNLYNALKESLITGTKMKFNNIVTSIKEFLTFKYTTDWQVNLPVIPDYAYYNESSVEHPNGLYNAINLMSTEYARVGTTYYRDVFVLPLIGGYTFRAQIRWDSGTSGGLISLIGRVFYGENPVADSTFVSAWNPRLNNITKNTSVISNFSIDEMGNWLFNMQVTDITGNNSWGNSVTGTIPVLEGLQLPVFPEMAVPQSLPVPYGLSFPWQIELDLKGYIGSTIDDILEGVASIPMPKWIEDLKDIPKPIIDSLPVPDVVLDEDGVIVDVEVPDIPDNIPDIKEQTGLLAAIHSFLMSIFEIPENIDLDFSPLQNLALKDKFPFSLPWDLQRVVGMLVAPGVAPRWELPIKGETLVIDLSQFDSLANISRNFLSIIFVVGLIIVTRRFVGGA